MPAGTVDGARGIRTDYGGLVQKLRDVGKELPLDFVNKRLHEAVVEYDGNVPAAVEVCANEW